MFFVGDIVRVVRRTKDESRLGWNGRMQSTIGLTGRITRINNNNHPGCPELEFIDTAYNSANLYHLDSIELETDPDRLKRWDNI